jgi:hypothetical protein
MKGGNDSPRSTVVADLCLLPITGDGVEWYVRARINCGVYQSSASHEVICRWGEINERRRRVHSKGVRFRTREREHHWLISPSL